MLLNKKIAEKYLGQCLLIAQISNHIGCVKEYWIGIDEVHTKESCIKYAETLRLLKKALKMSLRGLESIRNDTLATTGMMINKEMLYTPIQTLCTAVRNYEGSFKWQGILITDNFCDDTKLIPGLRNKTYKLRRLPKNMNHVYGGKYDFFVLGKGVGLEALPQHHKKVPVISWEQIAYMESEIFAVFLEDTITNFKAKK